MAGKRYAFEGLVIWGPWDGRIVSSDGDTLFVSQPPRLPLSVDFALVPDLSPTTTPVFRYRWWPGVRLSSTSFTIGFWLPAEPAMRPEAALTEIIQHYHRSKTNPERKDQP